MYHQIPLYESAHATTKSWGTCNLPDIEPIFSILLPPLSATAESTELGCGTYRSISDLEIWGQVEQARIDSIPLG